MVPALATFLWAVCSATLGSSVDGGSSLIAVPETARLDGAAARQQIVVSIESAANGLVDLTSEVRFRVEPREIARVDDRGVVRPLQDGRGVIIAEARGATARIPLEVVHSHKITPVNFRLDVAPVFAKAGCNMGACHGNLNGKGGFRLSLRGEDPSFDHSRLTRELNARRINLFEPDRSLILLKPTGGLPHEGEIRFTAGSVEASTLRSWIAEGGRLDADGAPRLVRLDVFPRERFLAPSALTQQILVTAAFSDGTRRDVTRQAAFDLNDPTHGQIDADGRVHANGPGELVVAVRYLDGRAVSRLAFPNADSHFVWKNPVAEHPIDRVVFAKLKSLRVNPSQIVADQVFLRRAFLDAIGCLPTVDEAAAFLDDPSPEKREALIDHLVARPEFDDFWAWKWADLLRNEEKTMGDKGVWIFQRWLRDQFARDVPLDEFTRRIITGLGSTWRNPPAGFYRTNRDPMTTAETVAQVFLGVRLQCARCHNHPFDVWTSDDYYGLAAYFANVRHKEINNVRSDQLDKHEINGDEIIFLAGKPGIIQPRSGEFLPPKPPHGSPPTLGKDDNALGNLAGWLTRDNPRFVRNLANRIWFHLLGRGVVDPVDDFRDSNPPSDPALLELLADRLQSDGMRPRPFVAWIMKSRVYQLDAEPNESNAADEANFSHAAVKLLPAEVLLDAIGQALDRTPRFPKAPPSTRAVQLPGARGGDFLKIFGKPDRLLTCECERSEATTLAQAFQMINGETVRRHLEAPENRIGRLLASDATDARMLVELTLAAVSRRPSPSEETKFLAYVKRSKDRRKAWEDVAWALLNSKEFLLRH